MKLLILTLSVLAWAAHLAVVSISVVLLAVLDHITAPSVDLLREAWDKTK